MSNNTVEVNLESVFRGPNPFSQDPVIVLKILVPELTAQTTFKKLSIGLQHLNLHWPLVVEERLFTNPLNLGDIAWLLTQHARTILNAYRGFIQEVGVQELADNCVRVWLGYHDWRLSRQALLWALESAIALGKSTSEIDSVMTAREAFLKETRVKHPDFQIRYVMKAAQDHCLPVLALVREKRIWQVGWGARRKIFLETATHADSLIGALLARDKVSSKAFLSAIGAPVAKHTLLETNDQLPLAAKLIGFPCAVKPINLGGGKGVTADVRSPEMLDTAFSYARSFSNGPIMVEQHIQGKDHRLLVIGGRLIIATTRAASSVVGDGVSTVRSLIDQLNNHRHEQSQGSQHRITVVEDDMFHHYLANQGFNLNSVPPLGETILMRSVPNISMGGQLTILTDLVHPSVQKLAESIACASGLNAVGLDYITPDISRDWHEVPGAFVEFNVTPGIQGYEDDPKCPPDWLAKAFFDKDVGRVPVFMVLMQKSEWLTWQTQLLPLVSSLDMGASGPQWVWANGMSWPAKELSSQQSASAMLRHATVTRAVVVGVFEEISQIGLPLQGVEVIYTVGQGLNDVWLEVASKAADQIEMLSDLDTLNARLAVKLCNREQLLRHGGD
jgi:cyanophycin synthetase